MNSHKQMTAKLQILENYIQVLQDKKSDANISIAITYFYYIYNFLIIESLFENEFKICGKELNNNLNVKELNDVQQIMDVFYELYGVHHKVRFAVETADSIESVRQFLKQKALHDCFLNNPEI
jgi:hydrogenase maturation factor HypF (carbamoyltransferase family)